MIYNLLNVKIYLKMVSIEKSLLIDATFYKNLNKNSLTRENF